MGSNPTSDKTQFCSWHTCVFHLAFPPSFSRDLSILSYSVVGFFLPLKTVPTSSSTQAYTQEGPGIPGRVTKQVISTTTSQAFDKWKFPIREPGVFPHTTGHIKKKNLFATDDSHFPERKRQWISIPRLSLTLSACLS